MRHAFGAMPVTSPRPICIVTGHPVPAKDAFLLAALRPSLADMIHADFPGAEPDAHISRAALTRYRARYVERMIEAERGEVSRLQKEVIEAVSRHETLAQQPQDQDADHPRTLGQRLSDRIAAFGGSWSFLIIFGVFMVIWMLINSFSRENFDPYPFILLNLLLSCLAAVQAPIIMMSQNRKEERDRQRAEHDYQVNLKAELEIRHLHEKIDHLLVGQWERLAAIQQMQMDMMSGVSAHETRRRHPEP